MRRLIAALLGTLLLTSTCVASANALPPAHPRFAGSFIQPGLIDGWSEADLSAQFRWLRADGLSEQILQWSAESDNPDAIAAYYPTAQTGFRQTSKTDVVGRTLRAADAAGIREYMGLQLNETWWSKYANDEAWLNREADVAIKLADELWAKYGSHGSFGGWYLAFEPDNENFPDQASWQRMRDFYAKVAGHLHAMTPALPVVVAPFYNTGGGQTPAQWRTMWTFILKGSQLDAIALQDGVGAGHATVDQLPAWFAATQGAIADAGVRTQLWADTETFYPDFTPMAVSGYVADMKAVAPYVTKFWSFSWDHYVSPLAVASGYESTYRSYLWLGRVETLPPTRPRSLTCAASGPQAAKLTWGALYDNVGVAGVYVLRDGVRIAKVPTPASCKGTGCTRPVPPRTFTVNGLEPDGHYTFAIQAFDAAGNVSKTSAPASVTLPPAPVTHVNLAAGRPYVASTEPGENYPDSGGELTDGVLASTVFTDAAWQGRLASAPFSFTVDLGSPQAINEVNSRWLQDPATGIVLPKSIDVAVSDDGTTWKEVGSMYPPSLGDATAVGKLRLLGVNVTGRYVRLTVVPTGAGWSFTDEVEVRQS